MEFMGICLITKNVPALVEFYCKILKVEAEGDEVHAELKTEGASLTIFSEKGMEKMAPNSMVKAGHGNFTIGIKVKNIDDEFESLRDLGVEFVKLPETYSWGCRSFWFRDPDGNIINFMSVLTK